jgi:hypothetical protein
LVAADYAVSAWRWAPVQARDKSLVLATAAALRAASEMELESVWRLALGSATVMVSLGLPLHYLSVQTRA